MRLRSVVSALAGTILAVPAVSAQDTPPPPVFQVTTLELAPATMGTWRNGLAKLAGAAKAANLPAAEVGWWAYNEGNRTIIVSPHSRDELFRNTRLQQRIAEAQPDADKEIREAFENSPAQAQSTEIAVFVPNLSYQPAGTPVDQGWVAVTEYAIAPGQGRAFNEAMQAMNKARADIKYPYAVSVYRVRMGEARTQVVTSYDTRVAFYGENSIFRLWEGNTAAQEAFGAARRALLQSVSSMKTTTYRYVERLSYPPIN